MPATVQPDLTDRQTQSLARVKVLGCGNALAGDDSAGIEIITRLRTSPSLPCELLAVFQPGPELPGAFQGADVAVLVDGVSSGAPPGTLHLLPLPSANLEARALEMISSHGWSLLETLELARVLGEPLPRLLLVGVEIGHVLFDVPRSAEVEIAIGRVVESFPRLLSLLRDPESSVWRGPQRFLPGDRLFPECAPCA